MNDSQSSKPTLRQLLRPRFLVAVILIILAVASLFTARYLEQQQARYIAEKTLPELNERLAHFHQQDVIIEHIEMVLNDAVSRIDTNHQTLVVKLTGLQQDYSTIELIKQVPSHQLDRLANNGERNANLTATAIELIEGAKQKASNALLELNTQIADAEQVLVGTLSNDAVTQQRLIAISQLKSSQMLLTKIEHSLSLLNIQLKSLAKPAINLDIDITRTTVDELIKQHKQLSSHNINRERQQSLADALLQVEELFMSGDALLGKWQGTTKLYLEYVEAIKQLQHQILQFKSNETNASITSPLSSPQVQNSMVSPHVILGLFIASLLFASAAIGLIIYMFSRVNKEVSGLVNVVEHSVKSQSLPVALVTQEQIQISTAISNAFEGAVTSSDVVKLQQHYADTWMQFANVVGACGWQIKGGAIEFTAHEYVAGLIGDKSSENDLRANINLLSFWRKSLNKKDILFLLQAAREAKQTGVAQLVDMEVNQRPIRITLTFHNNHWFGAIADNQHFSELDNQLAELKLQLDDQKQQALLTSVHDHETLSRMVVQTMLQSQNIAVNSGVNSQPVYRQLERMFDWLRQQQIFAKLASQGARQYSDNNIRQTMHALFHNINLQAHLKHNAMFWALDEKLVDQVKVNVRLFTRLLSAFCQLLLKAQFNSNITIKVDVIDLNAGQQVLKITGQVPSTKDQTTRYLLQLGQNVERTSNTRTEQYLFALLGALHGDNFTASQIENGVEVSFTLPLTLAAKIPAAITDTRLAQQHILVISADKQKRQLLSRYLKTAKAQCETLSKAEVFSKDYNLAAINKRKLDAVVITSEMTANIAMIRQHIESLPEAKRPVLLVMQNNFVHFDNTGLYSLIDSPIYQQQLIEQVAENITNKTPDNLLVPASEYQHLRYAPTHVELLLAVKNIEQHQPLWRTLVWLGFKVTVVADSQSMIKRWQTGRYLILMNEFETSPFVELLAGKLVTRGVFNFTDDEVIELDERQAEIGKHWQFGAVPSFNQVEALTKLLSPWLKVQPNTASQPVPRASNDNTSSAKTNETADFNAQLSKTLPPAFDMAKYAKNQGSPELAVFMLDEYLDTLTDISEKLAALITEKKDQTIAEMVSEINVVASILAAPALYQLGLQLAQANQNKSYDNMLRLLEQIKYEISVIKSFVDAI